MPPAVMAPTPFVLVTLRSATGAFTVMTTVAVSQLLGTALEHS